jgi:hypothetical protein
LESERIKGGRRRTGCFLKIDHNDREESVNDEVLFIVLISLTFVSPVETLFQDHSFNNSSDLNDLFSGCHGFGWLMLQKTIVMMFSNGEENTI